MLTTLRLFIAAFALVATRANAGADALVACPAYGNESPIPKPRLVTADALARWVFAHPAGRAREAAQMLAEILVRSRVSQADFESSLARLVKKVEAKILNGRASAEVAMIFDGGSEKWIYDLSRARRLWPRSLTVVGEWSPSGLLDAVRAYPRDTKQPMNSLIGVGTLAKGQVISDDKKLYDELALEASPVSANFKDMMGEIVQITLVHSAGFATSLAPRHRGEAATLADLKAGVIYKAFCQVPVRR